MKKSNNTTNYCKTLLLLCPTLLFTMFLTNCTKESLSNDLAVDSSGLSLKRNALKTMAVASVPSKSDALLALQVYNDNYFHTYGTYGTSYKSYYYNNTSRTTRAGFWTRAECIETQIDAYYVNPTNDNKNKAVYLYNGLRDEFGVLWDENNFNDDVIWGALVCVRIFQITGDQAALTMAKNNFNMVWNRAWSTDLGGGLWWTTANSSKNVCVNAPAVICALKIFNATGDVTYRDKGKQIMDWMVSSRLYNASTGEVRGAMNAAGAITEGALSYTQGTFIGACNELRTRYSSPDYLAMGTKAMDYARTNLCKTVGGILKDENGIADTKGMKSIFARWACVFVHDTGTEANYGSWLDLNAAQAWSIRNSNGLMWAVWTTRTSDSQTLNHWETNGGVSMMINLYRFR